MTGRDDSSDSRGGGGGGLGRCTWLWVTVPDDEVTQHSAAPDRRRRRRSGGGLGGGDLGGGSMADRCLSRPTAVTETVQGFVGGDQAGGVWPCGVQRIQPSTVWGASLHTL